MDKRSVVVFTLHKSASMLIHRLCSSLSVLSGLQYYSPNQPGSKVDAHALLTDKKIWRARSCCFAPVRFYVDIPDIEKYKIVLHLRDPRDVLVSMYYSYCFIHGGEVEGNTGYRKEVAEQGIDRFVLYMAKEQEPSIIGDYGTGGHVSNITGNLLKRYSDYIDNILDRENIVFVKYEDMVLNFQDWLLKFIQPFPLKNQKEVLDQLVARSPQLFPPREKDVMQHVRHITPGDHKNKLEAGTIEELNYIFRDVLYALGYSD